MSETSQTQPNPAVTGTEPAQSAPPGHDRRVYPSPMILPSAHVISMRGIANVDGTIERDTIASLVARGFNSARMVYLCDRSIVGRESGRTGLRAMSPASFMGVEPAGFDAVMVGAMRVADRQLVQAHLQGYSGVVVVMDAPLRFDVEPIATMIPHAELATLRNMR